LAGCERILLSRASAAAVESMREQTTVINLSQSADFEQLFLESLFLEPLKGDER
jgi:hypothetical protein